VILKQLFQKSISTFPSTAYLDFFLKEITIATASGKFRIFGVLQFLHPNLSPAVPLVNKSL
jgi:hypothetical protein